MMAMHALNASSSFCYCFFSSPCCSSFFPLSFPPLSLCSLRSYLALMRDLQKIYWLEPAGSKGVWGLDDYQFLPFLWGASQLVGQFDVQTGEIADDRVIERHCKDFMYLDAVKFVKEVYLAFPLAQRPAFCYLSTCTLVVFVTLFARF